MKKTTTGLGWVVSKIDDRAGGRKQAQLCRTLNICNVWRQGRLDARFATAHQHGVGADSEFEDVQHVASLWTRRGTRYISGVRLVANSRHGTALSCQTTLAPSYITSAARGTAICTSTTSHTTFQSPHCPAASTVLGLYRRSSSETRTQQRKRR